MSKLTVLSVSIAVLGGVWAFLAFGPLAGNVLVWADFIAWGCYFALGADTAALQKNYRWYDLRCSYCRCGFGFGGC